MKLKSQSFVCPAGSYSVNGLLVLDKEVLFCTSDIIQAIRLNKVNALGVVLQNDTSGDDKYSAIKLAEDLLLLYPSIELLVLSFDEYLNIK